MNLPNKLTVARVLLVPVFVVLLVLHHPIAAAIVFVIASLTDLLDGYLARKHHLITNFGKFMDPIADKLLVLSALIVLCSMGKMHYLIVLISVARELVISGVRMLSASKGTVIAAGIWGKLKTQTQMYGVIARLLSLADALAFFYVPSEILLWASVVLSVYSCIDYVWKAREVFSDGL